MIVVSNASGYHIVGDITSRKIFMTGNGKSVENGKFYESLWVTCCETANEMSELLLEDNDVINCLMGKSSDLSCWAA
jgi:hypothetical protein